MVFDQLNILLVEDNPDVLELMIDIAKKYKFQNIYSATNGQDGFYKYYEYLPDIVMTDYNMPLSNGLEMSERIKKHNHNTSIILITAVNNSQTIIDAINIGVDGYLFKPLNVKKFFQLVEKTSKRIMLYKNLQKEQKLLKEYKSAIDASAAVSKTNLQGIITYVNNAFCSMSGYAREELIGKAHSIVRDPNAPEEIYKVMWSTIRNKQIWQGRLKNIKKNKEVYYEHSVIVPILDEYNNIVEYIALKQNITDLYNQEQKLKERINKEVEKNLTLHKQHEEENLLEAKFSTIGKIAAGITHEINTPLTYARGNLELMLNDIEALDDSIKQKQYLQEDSTTVLNGINRIAYIVESMREMAAQTKAIPELKNVYSSLITALTLSHNKAKFISKIFVQDELFELGMDKNKFTFEAELQSQRIEQVFVIIINNALDVLQHIDDFEKRLIKITIEQNKEYVIIKFKDNGGGISESILPHIFDPFQSNKEEGGIGIGLNVAKRIIDDHHGEILPKNCDDGAEFSIFIPLKNKISMDEML